MQVGMVEIAKEEEQVMPVAVAVGLLFTMLLVVTVAMVLAVLVAQEVQGLETAEKVEIMARMEKMVLPLAVAVAAREIMEQLGQEREAKSLSLGKVLRAPPSPPPSPAQPLSALAAAPT